MAFPLNDEQLQALNIEENISLSAGAGSGKTRVLTERYIKLLEEDSEADILNIVAITFTNKAALEMKDRVRKAILVKLEESKSEERKLWQQRLDALSEAHINTIHGFCGEIIREQAEELNISPSYSIIDAVEKELLLREIFTKVVAESLIKEDFKEAVAEMVELYGGEYLQRKGSCNIYKDLHRLREKLLERGQLNKELLKAVQPESMEHFVIYILLKVEERYTKSKREKDLMDFNDMELLCYSAMQIKDIKEYYKNRYKRFLVDEFQDTNELQKKILFSFIEDEDGMPMDKRLFVVGDVKQSIYRFRGADMQVFNRVRAELPENSRKSLHICYRCHPSIVKGVNQIFKKLMAGYEELQSESVEEDKRITLLTYEEEAEEKADIYSGIKELYKTEDEEHMEELKLKLKTFLEDIKNTKPTEAKEGEAVLKAVYHLRNCGLAYRDMAVLVRSRSSLAVLEETFIKYKIPYCIIGGKGFYNKQEVIDILNLYKLSIGDTISNAELISVLRSPLFSISDAALLRGRVEAIEQKDMEFLEALDLASETLEEEKEKINAAIGVIRDLRRESANCSTVQLLKYIYDKTGVWNRYISLEQGLQKYRNLEQLLQCAEEFDNRKLFSPQEFMEYMTLMAEYSKEDGEAALDTEDSEAIKVMTIHASKGLEFKGVIMPSLNKNLLYNINNGKNNFLYQEDNIIAFDRSAKQDEASDFQTGKAQEVEKELQEAVRVFYVAVTRAIEQVVLIAQRDEKLEEKLQNEASLKPEDIYGSYYAQLLYAINSAGDIPGFQSLSIDEVELREEAAKEYYLPQEDIIVPEGVDYNCEVVPRIFSSASSYMSYKRCPLEYYLSRELAFALDFLEDNNGEEEKEAIEEREQSYEGLTAIEKGHIIHSVLEQLAVKPELREEELQEFIIRASEEELGYESYNEDIASEIKPYIDSFVKLEKSSRFSAFTPLSILCEAQYTFAPLEDRKLILTGAIDRLRLYEMDGKLVAVITDYKSNNLRDREEAEITAKKYLPQMLLYGLAVKTLFSHKGRSVDEIILQLYFLKPGEEIKLNFDEKEALVLVDEMDRIFKSMALNKIEDLQVTSDK